MKGGQMAKNLKKSVARPKFGPVQLRQFEEEARDEFPTATWLPLDYYHAELDRQCLEATLEAWALLDKLDE